MTTEQMIYTPSRTLAKFHASQAFVRVIVGPLGSGKSTGMVLELVNRASQQAPNPRKVRVTKFAIVRNTLQQLRQTVLPEVKKWLGPAFTYVDSRSTGYLRYTLPDGTIVDSEWMFIPLDTPQDVRRLLSLNITGAWISEVREVPYEIFYAIQGRIGRFRDGNVKPTWEGLICETNPWSEGSPYHENLVINPVHNWELFRQPGGLDPLAENVENLPDGYYERLIAGNTDDWINVHVHAQWGEDMSGQAVFGRLFNREHHVSQTPLNINPLRPLMVTHDFGRTPTALIQQISARGQLVTLKELTVENLGLEEFVRRHLVPELKGPRFVGVQRAFVVGDPTGAYKSSINEDSCFDVLRKARLTVVAAPTNDVEPRIRAVENLLMRRDAVLIDGPNCPKLVQALGHNYRYKRRKSGELDPLPEKTHPWSDLADCFEYGACSLDGSVESRAIAWERAINGQALLSRAPQISAAGWT